MRQLSFAIVISLLVGCHLHPGAGWARFRVASPQLDPRVALAVVAAVATSQPVAPVAPDAPAATLPAQPPVEAPVARPAPASPIPTTVTVHDAAPRPTFALLGQSRDGKNFCRAYDSIDTCNRECTSTLRSAAMSKDPTAPSSCSCQEGAHC